MFRPSPFQAPWTCTNEAMPCWQWGKRAAVWKAKKGWWASREGFEGIQGPFRSMKQAQGWAEAPWREKHEARAAAKSEAAEGRAAALRAKEEATWGGLPEGERKVAPSQVWALRDGRLAGYEVLVVEVKRATAGVLVRRSQGEPWKDAPREVRTLATLPRLYRLVGTTKVPKGR
jgi:hypothetical protein